MAKPVPDSEERGKAAGEDWDRPAHAEAGEQIENLEAEVERLREALKRIRDELGVPGDGYPAPVANAVEIARAALADDTEEES